MHRAVFFFAVAAVATAAARSVWDGVYSKEQARRGQAVYQQECAKCHGQNLAGGEASPTLTGAEFLKNWNGKTVGALYERTRKTMPSDDPGNLSTRQYADLIAYILGANEFPAGEQDLGRDVAALNDIRIEEKR
jgi:quinoprotein glucose dehydrogenase